jgi:hypothetical protein
VAEILQWIFTKSLTSRCFKKNWGGMVQVSLWSAEHLCHPIVLPPQPQPLRTPASVNVFMLYNRSVCGINCLEIKVVSLRWREIFYICVRDLGVPFGIKYRLITSEFHFPMQYLTFPNVIITLLL